MMKKWRSDLFDWVGEDTSYPRRRLKISIHVQNLFDCNAGLTEKIPGSGWSGVVDIKERRFRDGVPSVRIRISRYASLQESKLLEVASATEKHWERSFTHGYGSRLQRYQSWERPKLTIS